MEIIVKRPKSAGGELILKLRDLDFDAYRLAIMAFETPSGKGDRLAAGKIILEMCCTEGLKELEKDLKAYVSACLDAYNLLNLWETEVKKK